MKDIESLYSRAKFGSKADIAAYTEAVQAACESDPMTYLSELEYIIASGAGMATMKTFLTEHATLPLAASRIILETAELMSDRAAKRPGSPQDPYLRLMESTSDHLNRNEHLLAMFEAFEADLPDDYLSCIFEGTLSYQDALDRFGAGAIPDSIIGCFGGTPEAVLEHASQHLIFKDLDMKQWLVEAMRDLDTAPIRDLADQIQVESLGGFVSGMITCRELVYREAALTDTDLEFEYNEAEIIALGKFAAFQENMVVSLRQPSSIMEANNRADKAHLELDGLVDESCADIAAMLPTGQGVKVIQEGRDRKTGQVPTFIGKHHDLSYGEAEPTIIAGGDSQSKPSNDYEKPKQPDATTTKVDNIIDQDTLDKLGVSPGDTTTTTGAPTNNYYNYYNSFNKSRSEDRSSHNTVTNNDSSSHTSTKDDHSSGKRVNSNDNSTGTHPHTETALKMPWSLDLGCGVPEIFTESPIEQPTVSDGSPDQHVTKNAFSPQENIIRPGTKKGFRLFPRKEKQAPVESQPTSKPSTDLDPSVYTNDSDRFFGHDNFGFKITPGKLEEEKISEKLIRFLEKKYHTDENKIIQLVKTLAGDEHRILGNVVMEPGLETMWSDLYHLEDMLLNDFENVIFNADNGETILFEHIIGSYTFQADKVTDEKFNELCEQYHIEGKKIFGDIWVDEVPIAEWGRSEWGRIAASIFEELSFPLLRDLPLPKNSKLVQVYDDTLWDGLIGARIVFTDIEDTIEEFNEELGDDGSVVVKFASGNSRSITESTMTPTDNYLITNDEYWPDTGFFIRTNNSRDAGHHACDTHNMTSDEKSIVSELIKFLGDKYRPVYMHILDEIKTAKQTNRSIICNVSTDLTGNYFDWTEITDLTELLVEMSRSNSIIYPEVLGKNLVGTDRATMESINQLYIDRGVMPQVLDQFYKSFMIPGSKLDEYWMDSRNGPMEEKLEYLAAHVLQHHTLSLLLKSIKLPVSMAMVRMSVNGSYIIKPTDLCESMTVFNKTLNGRGKAYVVCVDIKFQGPDFYIEDAQFDPLCTVVQPYQEKKSAAKTEPDPEVDDPNNDPERPTSDHPVKDTIQDIDRVLTRKGAEAKKKVNDVINVGKVIAKPVKRTAGWINNIINRFKDADETKIKEKMADPDERSLLFKGIRGAIATGALYKAGLLLNPIFLFLAVTRTIGKQRNKTRLRSDIIGQLKTEIEVIDEKIKDADRAGDNAAKYKLMRFKNEIQKKAARVGGGREGRRIL